MQRVSGAELRELGTSIKRHEDLEKLFYLEKRAAKDFDHVGLQRFIERLNKRRPFRKSLRKLLKILFDLISKLKGVYKALQQQSKSGQEFELGGTIETVAHRIEDKIEKTIGRISELLSRESQLIEEEGNNLRELLTDEDNILRVLTSSVRELQRSPSPAPLDEIKVGKKIKQLALRLKELLDRIVNLYRTISGNYSELAGKIHNLVIEQVRKARSENINFSAILAEIERGQWELHKLVEKAEQEVIATEQAQREHEILMKYTREMLKQNRISQKAPPPLRMPQRRRRTSG